MELQPFGPVEQAIQNSAVPQLPKPKATGPFLLGVGFTLVVGLVGWVIVLYVKKKRNNQEKIMSYASM